MPPRRPLPRVLTSAGLATLDIPNDRAERAVHTGTWQRGARGIYLLHDRPPSTTELIDVAQAHVGPELIITGLTVR